MKYIILENEVDNFEITHKTANFWLGVQYHFNFHLSFLLFLM